MKQNLHYFFSILLTIILLSPPAAVWADDPVIGSTIPETEYFYIKNIGATTAQFTLRRGDWSSSSWSGSSAKKFNNLMYRRNVESGSDGIWKNAFASNSSTINLNFSVAPGDSVSFYNTSGQLSTGHASCINFTVNTAGASFEAGGDLMTLVNTTYIQKAPNYSFVNLFKNFTTLKKSDRLKISARSVGQGCCEAMFSGCTNLAGSTMDISAVTDTVYNSAFKNAFYNCSSLTTISSLPQADTIGYNGCYYMFKSCSNITSVPDFTTKIIGASGCNYMFQLCSGLTTIGDIKITTVKNNGCEYMFSACTGLKTIKDIEVTSVSDNGCQYMFNGCTSLESTGDIKIASIGFKGCQYMFTGCTSLQKSGNVIATSISNYGCQYMFNGCSGMTSTGNINVTGAIGRLGCYKMYCGCTELKNIGNINAESIGAQGCAYMYEKSKKLEDCSGARLAATTIGDSAYFYMFSECSNSYTSGITKAPKILATNVGIRSCAFMFYKCSCLTAPPDTLYAKTLTTATYSSMFMYAFRLKKSPVILATSMPTATGTQTGALYRMFYYDNAITEMNVRLKDWFTYYYNKTVYYYSTSDWISNGTNTTISATGEFTCPSALPAVSGTGMKPTNFTWNYLPSLTFDAGEDAELLCLGHTAGDAVQIDSIDGEGTFTQDYLNKLVAQKTDDSGLTFVGWFADGDDTPLSAEHQPTTSTSKQFIYYRARYASSVTYIFHRNNGVWGDADENEAKNLDSQIKTGSFPAVSREGYAFVGWNTNSGGSGDTYTSPSLLPDEDTELYAIWTPIYTFDVNTNGGGWSDETTAAKSWESGDIATGLATYTPSKSVNDFIGWNTEDDGTGDDLDLENLPSTPTTYYAIFTPIPTYTVTIAKNVDGYGSVSETSITDVLRDTPISIDDNELTIDETTVTATPASTTAEYTYAFSAWKNGETVLTGDANTVTSNMTITAHFTRTANDYTLTWAFDGGTTATAAGDYTHGTVAYGTSIVVPANPTKNGCVFAGWDATPASTMPAANTTYTAQWTAINYTFDVATNGGTWSDASTADSVRTVSGITALTTPQKDKFTFERWNTSADGTGTDMDASALPTTATKYYAIFIKVDYFRFIAQNATTTISTTKYGSETAPSLSYSTDNGATWNTFTIGTTSVVLAAGDSVCFRGVNANGLNRNCKGDSFKKQPASPYWYFTSTDSVSVAGNIMTLVQGTNPTNTIPAYNCFAAIMKGMPLVSAAKLQLPSSTHNGCYKYMFYNSSIRIAPELPALHVADSAYQGMFSNCQSLKIAPEIPATTVGVASMRNMFYDCWELTQAPSELKATQIYAYTYRGMFWTCKKLQTSPVIRATTMPTPGNSDVAAMGLMFRNCSTLVNVSVRMKTWNYVSSELSAAYYWLSYGSSTGTLTCPSALPTATRNNQTFPSGWTVNYIPELTFDVNTNGGTWDDASTTARVLEPETTWTIPSDVTAPANRTFVGWNTEADGTGDWLTVDNQPVISTTAVIRTYYAIYAMNLTFNVATAGATWDGSANENRTYTDVQFRRGEIPSPQRGDIEVCSAWVTAGGDTLKSNSVLTPGTVYSPLFAEYVCITAQTDNVAVGTYYYTGTVSFDLYYSTDGMSWRKVNTTTGGRSTFITLNNGEKVYLRGTNAKGINSTENGAAYSSTKYIKFTVSNNATLSGNLMTLIHPTNPPTTIPNTYSFAKLFQHINTSGQYCKITDASRLKMPATTILKGSYESMFENTLITGAPDLSHVDTVGHSGMLKMFYGCANLVNSPRLMATRLETNCYYQMFYNCSALRRLEVGFTDWKDDGSGNPKYTAGWMTGTTTNAEHNAIFIGPAALSVHAHNASHIQTNWKAMNLMLLDNQADSYYDNVRDNLSGYTLYSVTMKRNFWARSWVAFNVPFDFDILPSHPFYNNVYRFVGAEGDASQGFNIQFEGGVYHLDAGVPYLYYGTREDVIDPVFSTDDYYNDIQIKASAFNTANAKYDGDEQEPESELVPNPSNSRFQGTVRMTNLTGGDNSIIFIYANRLYYPNSGGNTMRAFQGYFKVDGIPAGVAPRVRMMVDGQETGVEIEEFGADGQAAETGTKKYIQDGVMVIERNGVKYDAQGHKLN